MSRTMPVNKNLVIELLPGTDNSDPALRLYSKVDPNQSFVIFLSEVHQLRDALATAGANLAKIEAQARKRRINK